MHRLRLLLSLLFALSVTFVTTGAARLVHAQLAHPTTGHAQVSDDLSALHDLDDIAHDAHRHPSDNEGTCSDQSGDPAHDCATCVMLACIGKSALSPPAVPPIGTNLDLVAAANPADAPTFPACLLTAAIPRGPPIC